MRRAQNVSEYITQAPVDVQPRLKKLRATIREVAPHAIEKISYGMPYYGYKGRLVYFAYFKNHIGVYISPPVIADHAKELSEYGTAMATVRFPHDKPLPIGIIKKLVRARMKLNEASNA